MELVKKFKIGDIEYENMLKEDLYINSTDLSTAYANHSERFAWYATAYELALNHENALKVQLERVHAVLYNEIKTLTPKMTEKGVEAKILSNEIYATTQDQYLAAKREAGLLKAARDAMIHRKDMLMNAGYNYRAEINSDVSLKAEIIKKTKG